MRGADAPDGPVRLGLRVYVDPSLPPLPEVRTEVEALLLRANAELGRAVDMSIELESVSTWHRKRCTGPEPGADLQTIVVPDCRGATLEEALRQLAITDPARDVELVIGLLPPLAVASSSFHQLGASEMLGRHIVLRDLDNLEERQASTDGTDASSDRARSRHKASMLLLHHIGHALGALHANKATSVMSPRYSTSMTGFAEENVALLRLARRHAPSAQGDEGRSEWMAALGEAIHASRWEGWTRADMFRALLYLGVAVDVPDDLAWILRPNAEDPPSDREGPADDPDALPESPEERALLFLAKDRPEDAWDAIQRALGSEPEPRAHVIACQIAARRANKTAAAIEACRNAIDGAPDEPEPALYLAVLLLQTKDEAGAQAAAESARRRLHADAPAELWLTLAQLFQALGDLVGAEDAALGARELPRGQEILDWARSEQARLGLPQGTGAKDGARPAADRATDRATGRAMVRVLLRADRAYSEGKYAEAIRIARAGLSQFPAALGLMELECRSLARAGRTAEAKTRCRAISRTHPSSVESRLVLSQLAASAGDVATAIRWLEQCLPSAGAEHEVWRLLETLYGATGREAARKRLGQQYRDRFGEDLR